MLRPPMPQKPARAYRLNIGKHKETWLLMTEAESAFAQEVQRCAHQLAALFRIVKQDGTDLTQEAAKRGERIALELLGLAMEHARQQQTPQTTPALPSGQADGGLTKREQQVLSGMARGLSNRAIGQELGIAEGTVKIHANRLFKKLGINDRTGVVMMALRQGLIQVDGSGSHAGG